MVHGACSPIFRTKKGENRLKKERIEEKGREDEKRGEEAWEKNKPGARSSVLTAQAGGKVCKMEEKG